MPSPLGGLFLWFIEKKGLEIPDFKVYVTL